MYSASSATVLHSNIARSGTSRCSAFCTRDAICVASNECPPSSKKLSRTPNLLDFQHLSPDVRQRLLQFIARRQIVLALQLADLQRRQSLAIKFAVGVERQAIQPQPVQRHHVFRQFGAQALLDTFQPFGGFKRRIGRYQITDQVLAIHPFLHTHRRFADLRLFVQARFDFPQFDAVTANLHLMVDAPDVFQHSVTAPTGQVAGAIQSIPRRPERVRHKHLRRAQADR